MKLDRWKKRVSFVGAQPRLENSKQRHTSTTVLLQLVASPNSIPKSLRICGTCRLTHRQTLVYSTYTESVTDIMLYI